MPDAEPPSLAEENPDPSTGDPIPPMAAAGTATPVEAPSAPDATSPARAPERSVAYLEENAVLHTLYEYAQAYQAMNVMATAKVWPSVDRRALARAFTTLKSQDLNFESCTVNMAESSATAHCRGTVQFVRKVGNPGPRTATQEWRFTMRKLGDDWMIEDVAASPSSSLAQARGQS